MIKALIFDVDGTLLDTERIYMRAWKQAGALFGYDVPDEALLKTRAVHKTIAEACFKEYCGADFDYAAIGKHRVQIAEEIIANTPAQQLIKPDADNVLQWLKAQGYLLAAASSTGYEKTVEHLRHAKLLDFFDVIVGGDMVSRGKPNPDIFMKAAELLTVEPAKCIVVGDTPADVQGGSSAKMRVILIPDQVPANEQTSALSWKVLNKLSELKEQLP